MSQSSKASNSYSVSKIHDFFKCPKLFELRHRQGVIPNVGKSADLEFGTAMHLGLEKLVKGEDGLEIFALYWGSLKGTEMGYGRLDYQSLQECGEVLLTRFQRLHLKHFTDIVCQEERLEAEFEGLQIHGTPDLAASYKGETAIVDFKTSGFRYKVERLLVADQLPFYASLLKGKFGVTPAKKIFYVFIKDAKAPSIQVLNEPLSAVETGEAVSNLVCQAKLIEGTKLFPKNTEQCIVGQTKCSYFDTCWGKK